MARIDIRDLTENQVIKLDKQVNSLGLKSRSNYIRLIIELDMAAALKSFVKKRITEETLEQRKESLDEKIYTLLEVYTIEEIQNSLNINAELIEFLKG